MGSDDGEFGHTEWEIQIIFNKLIRQTILYVIMQMFV